jgi:Protein of unknown function (DUF3579)
MHQTQAQRFHVDITAMWRNHSTGSGFVDGRSVNDRSRSDAAFNIETMASNLDKELFILGLTHSGKTFRPSDWAERLAGVMSQFRPGGPQPGSHLGYSPWCIPTTTISGVKCVIVHRDLRDYDVMAWDFCMNFAKDNDLQVSNTQTGA